MTIALDPKFAKVVRLMRSTAHEGERASARARGEEIARRCGVTFEEALRHHDAAEAPKPAFRNVMDGFDEWMEAREPGYKAREAERRAAKVTAWRIRKAAILARHGSEEAAFAPCWREQLILDAVAPWREFDPCADFMPGRWTYLLDGWSGYGFERDKMPAHVRDAIAAAYPLPTSFIEAKAEHDYWEARDRELGDLLDEEGTGFGDIALDMAVQVRADMVRDLAEKDLPVSTLADLHARFGMYRKREYHNRTIEDALFRDLTVMVDREASAVPPEPAPAPPIRPTAGQIEAALSIDPTRSDRAIARALGCSPTTVGQVRGRMGLASVRRSIQRGGQIYGMKGRAGR